MNSTIVPKSVQEAMSILGWKSAMEVEMSALSENVTWSLVTRPLGKTIVGCRWVYTVKYLPDGFIERLKARLVAKGYTRHTVLTLSRHSHLLLKFLLFEF